MRNGFGVVSRCNIVLASQVMATTGMRIRKPKPIPARATRKTHPDAMRKARLELGLSLRGMVAELKRRYGDDLKIDNGNLSRIERGDVRRPHPDVRQALCDFYGLPITYFD